MPKIVNPDWHPLLAPAMHAKHWTAHDLAECTGLSIRSAYNVLLMTRGITPTNAVRIERDLGVSARKLLQWQVERDLERAGAATPTANSGGA